MICMNVTAATKMTQFLLPGMILRKRGAIVNISSAAGRIPIGNPLYAEYSASKAYVDYFSRSLNHELAGSGVDVQCQSPYFVTTKLSKLRNPSVFIPSPADFVRREGGPPLTCVPRRARATPLPVPAGRRSGVLHQQ